jgi:hypothetical protein
MQQSMSLREWKTPRPMLPGDRRRAEQRARNEEALRRHEAALRHPETRH